MAISAEHRSIFAALHRLWRRLHMNEEFSGGTKNPDEQANKYLYKRWILKRDEINQ